MRDPAEITRDLVRLGLAGRTPVMLHAGLRKIGPIDGGANALIEAIRAAIGPDATLLMILSFDESEPFDKLTSPILSEIGTLAAVFRTHPGVEVSDHPAARFAALGPAAQHLLEPTPLHHYYGPGSTLERFHDMGGWILRLGADTNTITLTHWVEYLADVPNKRHARRRYVRADTGEVWIDSLDDSDGIVLREGDYFSDLYEDYLATGAVRTAPVGDCVGELFPCQPYVVFAKRWMEENLTPPTP